MAAPKKKARRRMLVEPGGVEAFEIRIVHWFDEDGQRWNTTEVTEPDGTIVSVNPEILGVMMQALVSEAGLSG